MYNLRKVGKMKIRTVTFYFHEAKKIIQVSTKLYTNARKI